MKAIYAGSFDPLTKGHLFIIKEASKIFDLTVVVGSNPDKKYAFSTEERISMLKSEFDNVIGMKNQYLCDAAKELNINYLIRGIRGAADCEFERKLDVFNKKQGIQTVFIMPPKELEDVSSSFVKNLIGPIGWRNHVKELVPKSVFDALLVKYMNKVWDNLWQNEIEPQNFKEFVFKSYENREYHNLNHILDMLELCEKGEYCNDFIFKLAIWCHDVIDERHRSDGVTESAKEACKFFDNNELKELILATNHGQFVNIKDFSERQKLFHDLDLSVLARNNDEYKEYCAQIRAEYACFSDADFSKGRKEYMKKMLQSKIFLSKLELEEQAIFNIKSEL